MTPTGPILIETSVIMLNKIFLPCKVISLGGAGGWGNVGGYVKYDNMVALRGFEGLQKYDRYDPEYADWNKIYIILILQQNLMYINRPSDHVM